MVIAIRVRFVLQFMSRDGQSKTIVPRVKNLLNTMGQRDALSFLDIKTANDLYKCAGKYMFVARSVSLAFKVHSQSNHYSFNFYIRIFFSKLSYKVKLQKRRLCWTKLRLSLSEWIDWEGLLRSCPE